MAFSAYPLKGVDDIEFGMTAEMVGERMAGRLVVGNIRATSPDHPTYSYPDVPVFFYFDEEGHLDGIEFCAGAEVHIGGMNPLLLSVKEAISTLRKIDPELTVDADGAKSTRLSIAIWCPYIGDAEDPEPVETLMLAIPGYFDNVKD